AGQNVLPTVLLSVTEDLASLEKTQVEACGPVQYKEFGTVLFPGTNPIATNSTGAVLRPQMTHPGYNGKFEVWLIGCIRYQDQFRHLYHTKFIYWLNDNSNRPIEIAPSPNTTVEGNWQPWRISF